MEVIKRVVCELTASWTPCVEVAHNDSGTRKVACRLSCGTEPWIVPEGATAAVSYTLPDGTPGLYDTMPDGSAAAVIDGSEVTLTLSDAILSAVGEAKVAVELRKDGARLHTFPFRVRVVGSNPLSNAQTYPALGTAFAGRLLYGGDDGTVVPLVPGTGFTLRQEDGIVTIESSGGSGVSSEELTAVMEAALEQARESGDFDGYTPVLGTDYWTEADKAAIVASVIEELGGEPVFGYVEAETNAIVLTNVPAGSYSYYLEMEDGTRILIGVPVESCGVTNALTSCTSSNDAAYAVKGSYYSATITADSGYTLQSVTVTMGGEDITASAVSGCTVTIGSVTGDIVITAVAAEAQPAEPVTVEITLRDGIRIGSDGTDRTGATGYCATERIDLSGIPKPCSIHLTGARWAYADAAETGYVMTCAKGSDGTNLLCTYTTTEIGGGYFTVVTNDGDIKDVTVTVTSEEVAEICFSGHWAYTAGDTFAGAKAALTYTPEA